MKETKFTPGPWGVSASNFGGHYEIEAGMYCVGHAAGAHANAIYNAKLMAVSPELYSLLEVAACPCCDGSGAYYDGYGEVCQCQWCDERTKVIAKARGES